MDAFQRIIREEGPKAFFSGSGPFVNRAMLVGAVQIGSYDQLREKFKKLGMTNPALNVFYASMVSGLLYSVITMPFETAKNRMAFQSVDPLTGISNCLSFNSIAHVNYCPKERNLIHQQSRL